jgi:hypothetical protein
MRIDPTPPVGRADRVALGRPATMRDPARAPIDVLIENLSETGALLRTDAQLPVGSLVSLGVAGLGMQLARVVRHESRAAAVEFMVPLERPAVARAATARVISAVAIPQILVERAPGGAASPVPAPASPTADAPEAEVKRLPVTPLPGPAEPVRVPLTYDAAGSIEPAAPTPEERPALDARALWLPISESGRPSLPAIGGGILAGLIVLAALIWLVA